MVDINCKECRQCNTKGRPSVMRDSAYCQTHVKSKIKIDRSGLFSRFKDFLFNKRATYDESGRLKEFKKKGFRESWFWR